MSYSLHCTDIKKKIRLRDRWLFYGTSSLLKFELVLMLIFLNLSWKRFLERYMTFTFIINFFPFLRCVCYKFPNMYSRVICKLVLNDILMSFLPGPSRRLAPILKCRRFLSFFQRYIVRDISLTEIYRWLTEILSAILKSTRHGEQSRERL